MEEGLWLALAVGLVLIVLPGAAIGVRVTPYKIVAHIGNDGTDDDVTARLCFGARCCYTHTLNSAWTNDWSKKDRQTWGKSWLGPCGKTKFNMNSNSRMSVELSKDSESDSLEVNNLYVFVRTTTGKETDFSCGGFVIPSGDKTAAKSCNVNGRGRHLFRDDDDENKRGSRHKRRNRHKRTKGKSIAKLVKKAKKTYEKKKKSSGSGSESSSFGSSYRRSSSGSSYSSRRSSSSSGSSSRSSSRRSSRRG